MSLAVVMPQLGDFMTEGVVAAWKKSAGDPVSQNEVIADIESEKMTYELEAASSGFFHPVAAEGDTVAVNETIAYVLEEGESPPDASPASAAVPAVGSRATSAVRKPASGAGNRDVVPSTPGARRLAAKLDVDLSLVTPTGPRGRILDTDVQAYADAAPSASPAPSAPPGLPMPSEVVPLKGMRKGVAEHMRASIANTAQLSFFLEVDVTDAQRLREQVSEDPSVVVTMPHVLIKACATALGEVPALNSVMYNDSILVFEEINLGVAVALDDGLVVPVIRNAESMSVFEISDATHDLAVKAREGRLMPDATVGGTFTISVLGRVDGFTPILNTGQTAILGAGRVVEKPVARDGEVAVRQMITLSLTVDHQAVDGAVAAEFLELLQELLESPSDLFR